MLRLALRLTGSGSRANISHACRSRSRGEKDDHNPLLSLTCSHETVSPSRNSRVELSRWHISSSAFAASISSRNDSIDW